MLNSAYRLSFSGSICVPSKIKEGAQSPVPPQDNHANGADADLSAVLQGFDTLPKIGMEEIVIELAPGDGIGGRHYSGGVVAHASAVREAEVAILCAHLRSVCGGRNDDHEQKKGDDQQQDHFAHCNDSLSLNGLPFRYQQFVFALHLLLNHCKLYKA